MLECGQMSRTSEILNRFATNSQLEISENRQTTTLWPRFAKLNSAITEALTASQNSTTKRELNTFNWSGRDAGISDHRGKLQGETDGILLDLYYKGTTVSNQPKIVVDETGKPIMTYVTERHLDISGWYVSKDSKKGFVQLIINNDSQVAAYWLEKADGLLHLEQVTDCHGNTYDADQLRTVRDDYLIPNTNVRLSRQCLKPGIPIETPRLNPKN
jgi:hypothetical protein